MAEKKIKSYSKLYSTAVDYVSKAKDEVMYDNPKKAQKILSELEKILLNDF